MMLALDCFLKSLFIFVIFYLVVTTYRKYSSSVVKSELHQQQQLFEAASDDVVPAPETTAEEVPHEPIPSGAPIVATPDNIPSDPIEIVGDGTKMSYQGKRIEGQRQLIQLNSEQAISLKKKFDVKQVQDVVRFEVGPDVFVAYRALSKDDFLDYFVFWNNQTPFRLPRPEISSDPSRESYTPVKVHKDIEFIQNVSYPTTLTGFIQDRAAAFQNRNTTMGPTAVDTKRVSVTP